MKSLVLHIGIPKTGSSSLQVFWAQNRAALLAQSVDYFPIGDFALGERSKISSGNGAHIARSLLRPKGPSYKPDRDDQLAALDLQIAGSSCDTGLLSSEIFIFAEDAGLSYFADWLASRGISLRIFYFIRNQVQMLTSGYIQQVKRHACTETAEEHILRVYEKIDHIKYSRLFERMAKIAEPSQIMCKNYHDAKASEHGIFGAFIESFGLDPQGLEFIADDVNVSLNMPEITIMLMLNKLKPRMVFSDYIVENAVRRGRKTADLVNQLLSRETIEKLQSYYAEDNARFARSHFGREMLFDELVCDDAAYIAGAEPSFSDVVDTIGGVLVRFDERLAALERRVTSIANKSGR